jgi:hypothetical protein
MAAPNQTQTNAMAWEAYVGKSPEDNIHDDYWLFYKMSQGNMFHSIDGGRDIRATLEYSVNSTVTSYTDTETFSTSRIDVFDEANFDWKEYVGVVVMSEREKAFNQGGGRKFGLQSAKLANLYNGIRKALNEGMFSDGTGNSSKDIGGLQHIVASSPSTGTVGGINRARAASTAPTSPSGEISRRREPRPVRRSTICVPSCGPSTTQPARASTRAIRTLA